MAMFNSYLKLEDIYPTVSHYIPSIKMDHPMISPGSHPFTTVVSTPRRTGRTEALGGTSGAGGGPCGGLEAATNEDWRYHT